jgi:hypothetical protein
VIFRCEIAHLKPAPQVGNCGPTAHPGSTI